MACLGAAGVMISSPAFAGAAAGPVVKEEIFVTGSRIGRNAFDSSSPIDVFTSEDFKVSGATSVDEFLKEIPAFTGFQYGTSTNNGNNGVKMVDLRGCGVKRTLTLINGRRQVGAFVGGPSEVGAVDLNTVPIYMVERIEVLKDGASTAYGSDALCGVVNVITKKNYDGAEINANIGWGAEEWDAKDIGIDAQIGTSSDKGWVMIGGRYQEQKEMKQAARSWAQESLWPILDTSTGTFTPEGVGSSNSNTSRLSNAIRGAIDATPQGIADFPSGAPSSWFSDPAGVRPFSGVTDSYNFSPINALITPNETWNINGAGEYSLVETSRAGSVKLFGEIGYTKRTSSQTLAEDASFNSNPEIFCDTTIQAGDVLDCSTTGAGNNGVFRANDWVPASNPFNPFGVNGATLNPYGVSGFGLRHNRRLVESGPRRFIQEVNTLRIVTGLDGEFNNGIGWEVAYVFADNQEAQETKFYHRFDKWQTAVDPVLCGADAECAATFASTGGVLNPFQPFGSIPQEQIDFLLVGSLKDIINNRMQQFQINFDGEAFELPGGPMGWAVGYERRKEQATYSPDEFSAQGLTTSGANNPLGGSFTVGEFYGETRLPLADGAGWANSFDIELGIRYSDYDGGVGDTTNGRIGIDWGITESIRLRGVYSTGFRAPNIVELFGGNQSDFPVVEDPCELWPLRPGVSQNVIDNCTADGFGVTDPNDLDEVSLATEYQFQYQSTFTQLAGGQLDPEESENFTIGGVWAPVDTGLQLSLDYWTVEIDGYIDSPSYNSLLAACYEAPNATRDSAPACQPFNGVYRLDGLAPDGEIPLLNLGTLTTSGVDFAIDYTTAVDWGPISSLDLSLLGTYLLEREEEFPIFGTVTDKKGTASGDGEVYPEWKWNTFAGVGGETWTFGWKMRYYSESDDLFRPAQLTDAPVAEEVLYHDLKFSYQWDQIGVNVGIDNLTDEDPPRFHSAFNANTEPGVYDVIGRRLWARLNWTF